MVRQDLYVNVLTPKEGSSSVAVVVFVKPSELDNLKRTKVVLCKGGTAVREQLVSLSEMKWGHLHVQTVGFARFLLDKSFCGQELSVYTVISDPADVYCLEEERTTPFQFKL